MQMECSAKPSAFGQVEGRPVVAEFDGGALTSDAGGLLLGAADRRLGLVRRLAGCFRDARDQKLVEHSVAALIGQRVFGIALGYEDLNDSRRASSRPADGGAGRQAQGLAQRLRAGGGQVDAQPQARDCPAQFATSRQPRITMAGCIGHKRPRSHSLSRSLWKRV